MITAYARIALAVDYTDIPDRDRTIDVFEHTTLTGEGSTWEEAQAACQIPEDAQVLSWSRWPICAISAVADEGSLRFRAGSAPQR